MLLGMAGKGIKSGRIPPKTGLLATLGPVAVGCRVSTILDTFHSDRYSV